jgi:glycosyltransferase involved in cell wall biosynthesis
MHKDRIKILFMTGTYAVGGKERQLTELIVNLPEDKFEIHLFVKKIETYYFDKIRHKLASVRSLNKDRFSLLDLFQVHSYIKQVKPDIVHSWATLTSHFSLISKYLGLQTFILINGSIRDAPQDLQFSFRVEAYLYHFYKVVISNSFAGLVSYRQQHLKNRYVIPNGMDMTRVPNLTRQESRELLDWDDDVFVVTMVACLAKRKDHETLFRAAKRCIEVCDDIIFIVVGDGELKSILIDKVNSMGDYRYRNTIKFLGERSDIEKLLLASDISVLLSAKWHGEGIPNVVLESMACGKPVIASDNGGTGEIVQDGLNGYLIQVEDDAELASKILFLKNHPENLKVLGLNAKETVKSKYTIEKMVLSYMNIYDSFMST